MVSDWDGPLTSVEGFKLKENLIAKGCQCIGWAEETEEPDLIIASETISQPFIDRFPLAPVINVVHSEYECETPLNNSDQIIAYVCIRLSIMEHIIAKHDIPSEKCSVIYNGVDRQRFKPIKRKKRDYRKTVIPCTLDTMREPFLNAMIDSATEENRVFIFGMDCGAKLHENKWAVVQSDKFAIEEDICDADEVAGILLGRVNLEAWSCGVPSRVYDPNNLTYKIYPPPVDFDKSYNIINVVERLLALTMSLDDITVVVPHHTAIPELADLLHSISRVKHVVIVKGGTFAENVNRGMRLVETKYALILNDDTTLVPQLLLRQLMSAMKEADIVGATPDNGCQGLSIVEGVVTEGLGNYPSGALLMVRPEIWEELGGFDEAFVNGAEDLDLYLRAEEAGLTIKRIDASYHHAVAASPNRYDALDYNVALFNKKWLGKARMA